MTNFICKLFIKNSNDITNPSVRAQYGKLAGIVGIVSNLVLFVLKFVLGILSGAISIIADAINNLSDMGSSVITLVGFKMASKKPDKEHPFGHERVEYIMGLIVSVIILVIGIELGKSSVEKIITPTETEFSYLIVVMLVVAILLKLWQSRFNKKVGKKINSLTLIATSKDSLNDVISTMAVLIGLLVSHFVKFNLDGYFGVLVAVFIIISGVKLVKETMSPLIGEKPDPQLVKNISQKILSYEGIYGIHDMICHIYGQTKIFVTVHCEVSSSIPIMESHELIDDIERDIKDEFNVEITIHLDPVELDNEELNMLRKELNIIIKDISPELSFHDLRMVKGINHTNLIFDLVVPFQNDSAYVIDRIKNQISLIDKRYNCVIDIDEDYVD